MNEDFLNIWVVVHDKATNALQNLSKHIKDADATVNKLDNSIGKLDNHQIKASKSFLDMGKASEQLSGHLGRQANAIKILFDRQKEHNKALDESIKKYGTYGERVEHLSNQSFKTFENRIRGLNKEFDNSHAKTTRLTGSLSKLKNIVDINEPSITRLNRAFDALSNKLHDNNNKSNTFYVRFLGMRLSMLAVVGAAPPLIGALVQLGGLLVAVADAAALAGAALGGALIAGIAQATPVIGLLVLAFKQLFDIIKLTGQRQKEQAAGAKDAADKSQALKQRLEQERQAHIALANAQRQLISARRDALRNIQDLNAAEKEAYLNSRRATLGLIGSQAALAGLVSGGGSALDVANAQLDVQDAQSGVSSANLNLGRARTDAATARKQGVGGNPQVIAAQQAIVTQQHEMALASSAFATQQLKTNQTLTDYNNKLKALDPAQRKLFDAVVALRKEFTKDWKGITDPIINAFTGIVQGITKALKDPDIQNAFKGLSGATGSAITQSTSFFGTPEAKQLFLQVIKDAKQNLPLIARILRDISQIFLRIAVAAGPFVHDILKAMVGFFDDLEKKTRNKKQLSEFFSTAFAAAKAFWSVLTGIFDIFLALGEGGAAKTGVELVGQLGDYLHNIADELRGNKAGTGEFFKVLKVTVQDLGTLLDHVLRALIEIAETGAFDSLLKVLDQLLLPVLTTVLIKAGELITTLSNFALAHPDIVKTAALIIGVGIATGKLIGIVGSVIGILAKARAAYLLLIGVEQAEALAAEEAWLATLGPIALVIAAIAAIGVAIFLLDKKFHFLAPTFKWLKDTFFEVIEFVSKHWKGLLVLLTGPLGLVIVTIVNNFDKIRAAAVELKNKMEPIFDFIVKYIVRPLYEDGIKPILDTLLDVIKFFDTHDLGDVFSKAFEGAIKVAKEVLGVIQGIYNTLTSIIGLGGGSGDPKGVVAGSRGGAKFGGGAGFLPAGGGVKDAVLQSELGRNPLQQGGGGAGGGGFLTPTGGIIAGAAAGRINAGGAGGGNEDITPKTAAGHPKVAQALAARALAIADLLDNVPRTDSKGNRIRGYPYAWGGGHGAIGKPGKGTKPNKVTNAYEVGFDCSGAVSAVLGSIGALSSPLVSGGFANWGVAAQGNEPIVVHYSNDHVWMTILGQDFSTGRGEDSGWGRGNIGTSGYKMRTLPGFASGGIVPGTGNYDTEPALLTPGEMVLTKAHQAMLGGTGFLKKVLHFGVPAPVAKVFDSGGGRDSSVPDARIAKSGLDKLVAAFTKFDQVLTDQAAKLTMLARRQASKIINRRFLVGGSGRNTVAIDTGSDLQDAQQRQGDLGVQRDSINQQLFDVNDKIGEIRAQIKRTPNTKKNHDLRQQLNTAVKRYLNDQQDLQDQLNQNTIDLINGQADILQKKIDDVQVRASRDINSYSAAAAIANLTGLGKQFIPDFIAGQIATLASQKGQLQQLMAEANAQGNYGLAASIQDSIASVDQQIAEGVQARFQATLDLINENINRNLSQNDLAGRLAGLGGSAFNSLGRQTGVLASRGQILRNAISGTEAAIPYATNPAMAQQLKDQLDDLNAQLAENTDAIRENAEQLKQAHVDQINNLAAFRGGINSGAGGLIQSLANQTGTFDTVSNIKQLQNQQNNLKTQGGGLRGQLLSQFGINLSTDPKQLIEQLNNTDFGALEFGMDDNTKSLFENLINGIITNATALVDNTTELMKANDQSTIQDWSSSLWSNFRDALFTGNGGILAGIPQAATGAHIISSGLMVGHAGETIVPATVSKYSGGDTSIAIHVDNRGESDVDTAGLSRRIGWELNNR